MNENKNMEKLTIDDSNYETLLTKKYLMRKKYVPKNPNRISTLIPGTIRMIFVKEGQSVIKGDSLLILEAMKMKNEFKAERNGVIKSIFIKTGELVAKGSVLIELETL
jgi:biotin carboxyl carrier protein